MVYEKKNKIKKKYICPNCLKDFGNLKYQFELHLNRVNPCKKNKDDVNINFNNNIGDETIHKENNDKDMCLEINPILTNKNVIENNTKSYINDIFENCSNFTIDNNYDGFDNMSNNNLILELIKKIDFLIEQNEKINSDISNLNSELFELKKGNILLKNQIITNTNSNNNTQNNCVNLNVNINNFNDTNDFKGNFNNLLKETGKFIYLKTVENMFLNPEKPENHNIYVADKNRGYAKIYNDGRWQTQNINIIDTIINKVVEYYKLSIEEIKRDLL